MERYTNALITAGGIYSLFFGIFHLFFRKIFNWDDDLPKLKPVNRAIVKTLNLCLALVFFIMGYVSIAHTGELGSTPLGRTILAGAAIFWFLRMLEQAFFFGLKKMSSKIFFLIFLAGAALYLIPFILIR